ncbi:hypothetical protein [Comamonas terrigena]|uniref:hypothetical protein n=1 Tax=Comamonas terrigena TaxID=32013 RepID=UPI0028AAA2E1|nr:hypothetical protein [Comamonas terrigena]
MKANTNTAFAALFLACTIPSSSYARNTPCSGKKRRVSLCSNGKFFCNDGLISGSKKTSS